MKNNIVEKQPVDFERFADALSAFLRDFKNAIAYKTDRKDIFIKTKEFIGSPRIGLHEYIFKQTVVEKENSFLFEKLTGLVFSDNYSKFHIHTSPKFKKGPSIEVHDLRLNNRASPTGGVQNQAIITLGQRCGVKVVEDDKTEDLTFSTFALNGKKENEGGCFIFRGGCTLIFDLNTLQLKHVISKPILNMDALKSRSRKYLLNESRAKMQYRCLYGDYAELTGLKGIKNSIEPLAHIHKPKNTDIYE